MKLQLNIIINREVANYQLSIINFANNFQLLKFSKRVGVASFGNFGIGHSLEIGNWKLKIRDLIKNVISSGIELTCEKSLA